MTDSPSAYFTAGNALFHALRWPDMERLSQARPNVAEVTGAIVRKNRGLHPEMLRISLDQDGWLEEVRLCLNLNFRPSACDRQTRGASAKKRVKIWRHKP